MVCVAIAEDGPDKCQGCVRQRMVSNDPSYEYYNWAPGDEQVGWVHPWERAYHPHGIELIDKARQQQQYQLADRSLMMNRLRQQLPCVCQGGKTSVDSVFGSGTSVTPCMEDGRKLVASINFGAGREVTSCTLHGLVLVESLLGNLGILDEEHCSFCGVCSTIQV